MTGVHVTDAVTGQVGRGHPRLDARRAPDDVAAVLPADPAPILRRYGASRFDWRPFTDDAPTVREVFAEVLTGTNRQPQRVHGRRIRLQRYPFDALMLDTLTLGEVYRAITTNGCLAVIDELAVPGRRRRVAVVAGLLRA